MRLCSKLDTFGPSVPTQAKLVDRDANKVGINAARTCAARWIAAGRRVALLIPNTEGADFNDLVQAAVP